MKRYELSLQGICSLLPRNARRVKHEKFVQYWIPRSTGIHPAKSRGMIELFQCAM